MIGSFLLFGFLICGVLGAPNDNIRVIGGVPATEGEFPYIVNMQFYGFPACGGSILDKRHILTAAHCVYGSDVTPEQVTIKYGILNKSEYKNIVQVESIKIHEKYKYRDNFPNDIAILKLAKDIEFGPNVAPTKLPTENLEIPGDSATSVLAGWGETENGYTKILLKSEFPVFSDAVCTSKLGDSYDPSVHICAGDLDGTHKQCSGDSGGPLYANGVQHGIVSWSFKPCTLQEKPGLYTRVANYVDWIKKNMKD